MKQGTFGGVEENRSLGGSKSKEGGVTEEQPLNGGDVKEEGLLLGSFGDGGDGEAEVTRRRSRALVFWGRTFPAHDEAVGALGEGQEMSRHDDEKRGVLYPSLR